MSTRGPARVYCNKRQIVGQKVGMQHSNEIATNTGKKLESNEFRAAIDVGH